MKWSKLCLAAVSSKVPRFHLQLTMEYWSCKQAQEYDIQPFRFLLKYVNHLTSINTFRSFPRSVVTAIKLSRSW